ncbi:MAG: hydroxymethylglutaryl-CoA reductase (NADPH) [Methanobrevibacter sp.]|jgi:hydroxymethylglutaryl-CoA reductase (NADPH)|nr:hydroxymethylglutaryl-CoA reductase (NADPH) [Candidatus Methanovirga meridionalis]
MEKMDAIKKLENGEIKMYQLDELFSSSDATDIRREYMEKINKINLENISKYTLNMDKASQKNIENPIGTVQIPVGIAGPLKINGKHAKGEFYIPIATSEGALVASINRGCSVITAAGGVNTLIIDDKMTRAPVIRTKSIHESYKIKIWIENNFLKLKEIAETTTKHGKLIKIDPILIAGNYVYPRFNYSTGDSMGMNMVTIATEKVLELLEEETSGEIISLSGNACVDKKPANINLIEGRGKSLMADILIPEEIVHNKLKTTAKSIEEVNTIKNLIGSAVSGSMGFNAHYANIVAGLFLATGQDIAHVVEGSLGITTVENRNGNLYFSVTLPDLPIATVGGGTSLETATESLKILDCYGSGKVEKLAEIIVGAVLGGELSLIAALSAGHLAKAHKIHGRAN